MSGITYKEGLLVLGDTSELPLFNVFWMDINNSDDEVDLLVRAVGYDESIKAAVDKFPYLDLEGWSSTPVQFDSNGVYWL